MTDELTPKEQSIVDRFNELPPEGKSAVLAQAWRLVLDALGAAVDDAHRQEAARAITRDLCRRGICQGAGDGGE